MRSERKGSHTDCICKDSHSLRRRCSLGYTSATKAQPACICFLFACLFWDSVSVWGQVGLELTILLFQPPECWDYRCATGSSDLHLFIKSVLMVLWRWGLNFRILNFRLSWSFARVTHVCLSFLMQVCCLRRESAGVWRTDRHWELDAWPPSLT
jgi:hypothetical protein